MTGIVLSTASAAVAVASAENAQRIRIRMGDQAVTATLNTSEAARDLVAMLPLSIRMRDHLWREKTGPIPASLSERTEGSPNYQPGDLGYWRPGGNFVIFYRQDGLAIPSPVIVILGRVDSGAELFDVPGPVEVTLAKCSQDTALRDIQDLVERGLLVRGPCGGRSSSYTLRSEQD